MSSCKLICKPWCIVLLCGDCAADQMSFCSSAVFHLDPALVWLWLILCEAAVSVSGACVLQGGGIPALGVPACREGAAAPCSQSLPPGRWYSRRKARQSRLTAARMFTDQGLAAPWRHQSLSPVSSVLQGERLKTKMLALSFKNSR